MLKTGRHIFLCVFLITIIHSTAARSRAKDPISLLMKLMATNDKSIVIYVDTKKLQTGSVNFLKSVDDDDKTGYEEKTNDENGDDEKNDFDDLLTSDVGLIDDYYDDLQTLENNARNQAKYLFYNFLRTSPEQDREDADLEETKQVLRQALRSRCKKVDKCVKKCPKKKPSCPTNCQQVFDNLDLCDPPKPKKCYNKPRCGKTMPPKWLL